MLNKLKSRYLLSSKYNPINKGKERYKIIKKQNASSYKLRTNSEKIWHLFNIYNVVDKQYNRSIIMLYTRCCGL